MCVDKTTGEIKPKFKEMITSGKTGTMSATGFMGIVSGILALVAILALLVFYFAEPAEAHNIQEFMDRIIVIFSISAGLLGVRKISGVIGNKHYSAGDGAEDIRPDMRQRDNGGGRDRGWDNRYGSSNNVTALNESQDA